MTDKVIQNYQQRLVRNDLGYNKDDSEDDSDLEDDEILELLEDEFDNDYREQRMQELSNQFKQSKKLLSEEGHGSMETVISESQVLQITTTSQFTVIHFFHPRFAKCAKMDDKLSTLAQNHLSTKFIRINVDDAPFLVTRLSVKVLPCVVVYVKGVETGRIIGFNHLEYDAKKDDFTIESLEAYLLNSGVLKMKASSYKRLEKRLEKDDDESDLDL